MIKAVLFDWGDTVMEELAGMHGPMAEWSRVEATPGIAPVLAGLRGRVPVGIATNAEESDAPMVRKALARVGLDESFTDVFTARNLGFRKPDARFFLRIAEELGCRPEECLMVGNAQSTDAGGAADAGLRAIWLMRSPEPLDGHPHFDGVLTDYEQFEPCLAGIETGSFPTYPASLDLLRQNHIKPGLFRHVQKVALTAYTLALWLLENGVEVDPILVHRAALLHDIDKGLTNTDPLRHGQIGAELVRDAGYPALFEPIYRHQVTTILDQQTAPQSLTARLVYLADKLVERDTLVGVEARLRHLAERHPSIRAQMEPCLPLVLALQADIIRQAGLLPEHFLENLARAVNRVDLIDRLD
jgi:putative nucleotidyltransferase with HDIG domain